MYKIIVADEEKKYVLMINSIIDKNMLDAKVIGYTVSGSEAITKVKELKPDIFVTNIRLLDKNGIEVIKEIRKFNSQVHIIVLTSYDYFDFISEAITSRVDNYLLEPVKKDYLSNVLCKAVNDMEEKTLVAEERLKNEKTLKKYAKYAEYCFIYSITFNSSYAVDIAECRNELEIDSEGYILNIEVVSEKKSKSADPQKISDDLYQCIKNAISRRNICVVGPRILDRIVVYVCEKIGKNAEKQKEAVLSLCEEIINDTEQILEISLAIGAGEIRNIQDLHLSYEESLVSLRYEREKNEKKAHIQDINKKYGNMKKSYAEVERFMLEGIELDIKRTLDYFSDLLEMLKPLQNKARKNKIMELLILCAHAAGVNGNHENIYLDYIKYFEEIQNVQEEELDAWAFQKLQFIMKGIRIRKLSQTPESILFALKFIENSYTENIQLEDVANEVGLTPQYFSTYFKEEVKSTFVEYLTKLRMEKAKELILNSQISVQEICFLVGYHDPNYFSRLFKKYSGSTPTEYKNSIERK